MPADAAPPAQAHTHPLAGGPAGAKPKLYNPRHPERTLLYQTIAEHFETWFELASAGQFAGQGDHHTPKPYVRQAFRKYLECGIFAHGFARAWCDDCGHDYFVAYEDVLRAKPGTFDAITLSALPGSRKVPKI